MQYVPSKRRQALTLRYSFAFHTARILIAVRTGPRSDGPVAAVTAVISFYTENHIKTNNAQIEQNSRVVSIKYGCKYC
jgi:hypothetical protein